MQRLGDGSMSMFPSSLAAVRAAVAVQRELAALDVPVRIGIHTGEVIVEPERLTGEAVNVASRIESFATPGGVMLSDSAYEQIRNQADLEVVSLGRFKLKNVGRPFDIYAVRSDGLVVPDATALEGKGERIERFGARLPEAAAPLIGRADDLTALANLAQRHRIVTITGPGGVGKTTVLAELGRTLAPELLGAVAFVSLAEVDDPTAVLPSLAEALDVKEADARVPADGLVALIGDAESLLLLDNLEQVIDAGPDLAALVKRCPALRIVATSRTPLRVAGEQEYPLSPLPLPPPSENGSVQDLLAYPSVALFVERARSAKTAFALTPANAAAVAAICGRLDGLPLALELAAARLRLLSPEALLERLDHALDVLTSAQRDLPERQRTLRATIDWSHSLLDEPERRVLRRLSTFVGGCSVEDAEAVCAEPAGSCLDQLDPSSTRRSSKSTARATGSGCSRPSASSHASSSMPRTRPPRSHCATPGGTHRPLRRYATASRAPTRSVRSSEASPRRRTSRPRSTRSSQPPAQVTPTLPSSACRCRATCGCTGTSAARTSLPERWRRRSSTQAAPHRRR